MTESQPKMKLSQKEILTRLLNLMANAESFKKDFSPENLEKVFGIPILFAPDGSYGYVEEMSNGGGYGFRAYIKEDGANNFNLSFDGIKHNGKNQPDMTPVCEMTMDDFGIKAKELGFSIKPIRALGRAPILEGIRMTKGKLTARISLSARNGIRDDWKNPGPACIEMISFFMVEQN
ncbi:hypothetical protein [Neisseria subflava]|uniref:hypothetical protein n=1 Tax=Neisseria subflava TaxID=28449 RepID=UPI00280AD9BC|nr:hypothetical protein [Neisseria subflava]